MQRYLFSILILAALWGAAAAPAWSAAAFRFESQPSLSQMREFIIRNFPLGTARKDMRRAFVEEGKAALVAHPLRKDVEKYVYDINLCEIYVWRWNISADYDEGGRLLQAYVNGRPVFLSGKPPGEQARMDAAGRRASTEAKKRPRPEAAKGMKEIPYMLFDADGDPKTLHDRAATGTGPERADPFNIGAATVVYQNVDPWRSIFDEDKAPLVPYPDCKPRLFSNPLLELLVPELSR